MPGLERDPPNLELRLELARELAQGAAQLLMERFGRLSASQVVKKGAVDLLTEADQASEDFLRARIAELFPDDAVLAEESGGVSLDEARGWVWVVDPLDGTTNFVHGSGHFAVSVGLVWENEPVAGAIAAPVRGHVYHGAVGLGAWCGAEALEVSTTESLSDALLATGFPYDRRETAEALVGPVLRALQTAQGLRRAGAACLDFVDVARGVYDGYWEPRLMPWDMAAGIALVRAAGGEVSAYGGAPHDLRAPQAEATLVCSNGRIHPALVEMISAGGAGRGG